MTESVLQCRCDSHECACSSLHQVEECMGKMPEGRKVCFRCPWPSKDMKNKWEGGTLMVIEAELT